ncbi:transglycosylase family protein [Staphylococcus carnosus]|uniref:transglycosylase family protein n=1 Tax=Staphylococcus carnosus TaxID=1281 RepID=UPI000CD152C5|nr:transglycosylase family protein [Staphylococcus carnosus]PNZ97807.1 transglycosylase [Staphylococcus carnosus]QRQ04712.1 transglycosylase family protein [Staphylococcus carnosus]UTB83290.1 transglycosylase [Staphylococcus carnosus]SUM05697.1 SceD protein [Staphylococcus carnosus]GEP79856.1 putative transglycosylase SceD [Staphylococcus carnosus]
MKKLLVASSASAALFAVGVGANAHAAEDNNVNQDQLAQTALNNPQQINDAPVQEGAYNIAFDNSGYNFNFNSDGTNWSWSYNADGSAQQAPAQSTTQEQAPAAQQAPAQEQTQQPAQQPAQQSADSGSNVQVNDHLKAIAQRESGGDIHAINPSSGAAGKYQFLQTTWDSVAPAEYQGKPASEAPEAVQDAAAQKLYDTAGPSQWVTA